MRNLLLLLLLTGISQFAFAQLDIPSPGNNPHASITEEVGITSITLKYSRPDLNGREGKIWGTLVPYGFNNTSFNAPKPSAPWRAGANENTTIQFEHDVKVEGQPIKAGIYALFIAVEKEEATIIFSNQSSAWGSFNYSEKDDALRVKVKPVTLDKNVEFLKYEFIDFKNNSCTIAMQWEKLSIPFKIEVDVDNIVLASLRNELGGQKGFNSSNLLQAVQYCTNKNINLPEALSWAQRAINGFGGQRSFGSLSALAGVYDKMGKTTQADSVMTEALTLALPPQYTGYARSLIAQKRLDKALEVMKLSQSKNGESFPVHNGLMLVYAAKGDFKNALISAEKAKATAPNEGAKKMLDGQIAKLKEGKDVN